MDLADLGAIADEYHRIREERLAADKVAATLASQESSLKSQIISALLASGTTAVGGQRVVLNLKSDPKYIAQDWSQIWEYIFERREIDLLEKRLLQTAFKQRAQDGIYIPGTMAMEHHTLTLSKPKD